MGDGWSGNLLERDADAVFLTPDDLAGAAGAINSHQKHELVGYAERAGYLQRRSGSRLISNDAVNRSAVELNGSGFQRTVAERTSLIIHPAILG